MISLSYIIENTHNDPDFNLNLFSFNIIMKMNEPRKHLAQLCVDRVYNFNVSFEFENENGNISFVMISLIERTTSVDDSVTNINF